MNCRKALLFSTLLALAMPVMAAKGEIPDRAKRFRIQPPKDWKLLELSCNEWRYDRPDGSACIYLRARRDIASGEAARSEARKLAGRLFGTGATERLTAEVTLHGAPITQHLGHTKAGRPAYANTTAISLEDGSALLFVEFAVLPVGLGSEMIPRLVNRNSWTWRSLQSTGKIRRSKCTQNLVQGLLLPPALHRAVNTRGGFLGIEVGGTSTASAARPTLLGVDPGTAGVRVSGVVAGSPAAAAGIEVGDKILAIDGSAPSSSDAVVKTISGRAPGEKLELIVNRNGRNHRFAVTLASRPGQEIALDVDRNPHDLQEFFGHESSAPRASGSAGPKPVEQSPSVVSFQDLIDRGMEAPTPSRDSSTDVSGGDLGSHPRVGIHAIRVVPNVVAPGQPMAVEIDLTLTHSGAGKGPLALMLHHSILHGGRVVYTGKPERIEAPNGVATRITKRLSAAQAKGDFAIQITLMYESAQTSSEVAFRIE